MKGGEEAEKPVLNKGMAKYEEKDTAELVAEKA